MRMPVVVAVTGGGVVRRFLVRMTIVVTVTLLLIMGFDTITNIAIGMRGSVLMFGSIGTGGLSAGEEQGGEGKGCEYFLHLVLGAGYVAFVVHFLPCLLQQACGT